MRKTAGVLVLLFVFAGASYAQQPAADPAVSAGDQATTEDVLQMFKEMHFEQQMANMQTAMTQQMKQVFQNMLKGERFEKLPADKKAKLMEMMNQSMTEATNVYPIKEIIADFAPMYAKYLTKADVQAITAFYHSPTGQKLLEKNPDIMRDAMAVIGPKMQQRMSEYMEKTEKRATALMTDSGDEKSSSPQPAKN
jgi:hypothetical protein